MAGYGDKDAAQAYWTAAGYVVPNGTTDAQITAALQRGSLVIDRYEHKFPGRRTGGFQQERAWPRTGASTYYGEAIREADIPAAIINASYEAAFLELTNPSSLSPVVNGVEAIKREKIGQIETEYAIASSGTIGDLVAMSTPVVVTIEALLWMFFVPCLPAILVV